jgi:hypothetical protein
MLFVLQTSWYHENMLSAFVQALTSCLESSFTPEDAIKPVVAYLAANLHSGMHDLHIGSLTECPCRQHSISLAAIIRISFATD